MTNHIVSMRGPGNAPRRSDGTPQSLAICQCGWRSELPWPSYADQDASIFAHWQSVSALNGGTEPRARRPLAQVTGSAAVEITEKPNKTGAK
jgi:hypothetical protein